MIFFKILIASGEFGTVPESYVPPEIIDHRIKHKHVSVDFGDAFFMDTFLHASGMMGIVDTIEYGNRDTLHAMLLFYMLSGLANCDAVHWYEGSVASLLYPKANLTSQRLSDFLAAIGTPEKQMIFQKTYIKFVMEHYNRDNNILIDSSGLPNSIHFSMTEKNVHNGKVSNEIRLIFVAQKSSGLPLYYRAVPGNIVDVSTLSRIFLHLDSMGIDVSSCINEAVRYFKENAGGKVPAMKSLKTEKEQLQQDIEKQKALLSSLRREQKELQTASSNIDAILGEASSQIRGKRKTEPEL